MSTLAANLPTAQVTRWRLAAGLTLGLLAVLVGLFWPTFYSMVEVWERSETFTHGFLIIWGRRLHLAQLSPQSDWRGLVLLALAGIGWLLADAGSVSVAAQYAFIALLVAAVWTVLGLHVVRAILFPLMFLFMAVPIGEFLIPPLMNFTADFTVSALQFTGVPVYREGTFFSIPSGDWSVVEGCSGLRYLIASITLGTLYAYLTYRSWKRRALFTLAAFIVPVFANGARAYLIVMIAHLSNMQLAVGVDHFIYGWVFFGLVMLLLFWIGSFWREDEPEVSSLPETSAPTPHTLKPSLGLLPAATLTLVVAALWPAYAIWLDQRALPKIPALSIQSSPAWQAVSASTFTDWTPHWLGADRQFRSGFARMGQRVMLQINYYVTQRQNAELINSQNYMIPQLHPVWANVGESVRTVDIAGRSHQVRQTLLKSSYGQRLLVWQWNVIDGQPTVSELMAKLILAVDRVKLTRDDGASVMVAAPYADNPEEAAKVLTDFIQDNDSAIQRGLKRVAEQ
jgi:exosortase A